MIRYVVVPIIVLVIAGSCNKNDKSTESPSSISKDSLSWGNFKYKNVNGYVTRTPWTTELLVVSDTLSSLVSDRFEVALTIKQERELLEILNKADVEGTPADCFYPRHGFVFWDSVGRPVAHVSICFECNRLVAQPELEKYDLIDLEIFCRDIGLPVFDNPGQHEQYFDSLDRDHGIDIKR